MPSGHAPPAAASRKPSRDQPIWRRMSSWASYTPSDALNRMLYNDKKCTDTLEALQQRQNKARNSLRNARAFEKSEKKVASWVNCIGSDIKPTDTWQEMTDTKDAENEVADAGGVDEIMRKKKVCDEYDQKMADKEKVDQKKAVVGISNKSRERREIHRKYRAFLSEKGYVHGNVYMIKWSNLVEFGTTNALPTAYSFALVLGSCEHPDKNADADPNKVHIRLTFIVHTEVNELYIDDPGQGSMLRVTQDNAVDLCTTVFADDNVDILHRADGGAAMPKDKYAEKLRDDSLFAIKSHAVDTYAVTAAVSRIQATSTRRTRFEGVYSEIRSNGKRRRTQAAQASSSAIEAEVEVEVEVDAGDVEGGADDEDVVVSSLAASS